MSCNGCRVLRKGCSDACVLRPSLRWIDSAAAQANATAFVAKFFGRAGLLSFLSSVPSSLRPALFQSLLFEACGRTVNPVGGAVGLLWTGRWAVCQAAVDSVLRGGAIRPVPDNADRPVAPVQYSDAASAAEEYSCNLPRPSFCDLGLSLSFSQRPASPSEASATTSADSGSPPFVGVGGVDRRLLNLFV